MRNSFFFSFEPLGEERKIFIATAEESLSFQVGNAYLDDNKNTKGQIDYLWSHGVISDEVWSNITRSCKFSPSDSNACSDAMASYDSGYISGYNIYAPVCINEPNGNYYPSSYVRALSFLIFLIKKYKIVSPIYLLLLTCYLLNKVTFHVCLLSEEYFFCFGKIMNSFSVLNYTGSGN